MLVTQQLNKGLTGMHSPNTPESIGQIIHKESLIKEKLKTKGLKPLGKRKDYRLKENTAVETQTQMSNVPQTKGEQANRSLSSYRLEKLRLNAEIDAYLEQLLRENMINQEYYSFHAKAVHTLTLTVCRNIYLNALNGSQPQRLYAYKIKGAMQLQAKQLYDSMLE